MQTSTPSKVRTAWKVDPVHSSVEFAVKHMVIATVRGRFGKFDIDVDFDQEHPDRSSVEARIDVASIDTREADRDKHLRSADFFAVEKYPEIAFKSKRVEPLTGKRSRIVGDLTIRDVTREVVMNAEFTGLAKDPWGKERAGFNAETSINRKDFGLAWNVALETGGWLVGDTIKIYIEVELVKQDH